MKLSVATDHGGFILKQTVIDAAKKCGADIIDHGANDECAVDFPDYAAKVAADITTGRADRGILICGSGVGVCMTAAKFKGVRAAVCHDTYSAAQGVQHDDMNVLCLGGRIVGPALAEVLVKAFLEAKFDGEPKHKTRLEKFLKIENENLK